MRIFAKQKEIKTVRMAAGHTQISLSKKIGIAGAYLSQIEAGIRTPSPKVAKKICKGLKVNFEDIFFVGDANDSKIANES